MKNFGYIGATEKTIKERVAKHRTDSDNGSTTTFHKAMRGRTVHWVTVASDIGYHDAIRLENEMIKTHGSLNDNTVSTGLIKHSDNRYSVYHINKID